MGMNYKHGYEYPISNDVTLCGFRASLLVTIAGLKGVNCPKCWEAWKKIKAKRG